FLRSTNELERQQGSLSFAAECPRSAEGNRFGQGVSGRICSKRESLGRVALIARVGACDRSNTAEVGALLDGAVRVPTGSSGRTIAGGFQAIVSQRRPAKSRKVPPKS